MPLPLAVMGASSAISLLVTALGDLLSSDDLTPEQIQKVNEATVARAAELEAEGISRIQAQSQAEMEARQMASEMADAGGSGIGDYAASGIIGAATGLIPGVGSAMGKIGGKLASFLRGAKPAAPVADDIYRAGFASPSRAAAEAGGLDRVRPITEGLRLGGPARAPRIGREMDAEVAPMEAQAMRRLTREPRTIDVAGERVRPLRLGTGDDAALNAAADDVIEAAMSAPLRRLGMVR